MMCFDRFESFLFLWFCEFYMTGSSSCFSCDWSFHICFSLHFRVFMLEKLLSFNCIFSKITVVFTFAIRTFDLVRCFEGEDAFFIFIVWKFKGYRFFIFFVIFPFLISIDIFFTILEKLNSIMSKKCSMIVQELLMLLRLSEQLCIPLLKSFKSGWTNFGSTLAYLHFFRSTHRQFVVSAAWANGYLAGDRYATLSILESLSNTLSCTGVKTHTII